jgi:heme exporter protein B
LPLEFVVLAKLLGHYIALVLPLLLAVPLAGLLLNLAPAHLPMLLLAMLAGSPALVLLGGIGASLAVSVRRGGLLTVLLSLPFYVPVMIFGAGASQQALAGEVDETRLAILLLISLASLLAAPVAIAAALRNAVR